MLIIRFPKFKRISSVFCRTVHTQYSHSQAPVNSEEAQFSPPFTSARLGHFFQQSPVFGNFLQEDKTLLQILNRNVPEKYIIQNIFDVTEDPIGNKLLALIGYPWVQGLKFLHVDTVIQDLSRFSNRLSSEIHVLGFQCENEKPYVQTYDAWGKRIDKLVTCSAWKQMHDISAEEGLIALGYENPNEEWRRLHQMAKLYMYASSSGLYSCPLAMTDGAATIIRKLKSPSAKLQRAYNSLTSRNPSKFWTSGQWMTEKRGGSDVANGTETVAEEQNDGSYRLYGYKWFSSATDSDMSFTLARVMDKDNNYVDGTKGLSLFYLETKQEDGSLNNIQIIKLKDKLGTRQLPTAELLLDGTIATRVSELGKGVAEISSMLTLTRIHNALAACSSMRKLLMLCKDYSQKREAFGNKLHKYPLHVQTLARMEIEARAGTLFVFQAVLLLSKQESGKATQDELHLLRLLTPLVKLYTGKQAMSVSSEGLESFGGQGYIEETGLPNFLRDSQSPLGLKQEKSLIPDIKFKTAPRFQNSLLDARLENTEHTPQALGMYKVLTIWEGTTNILSLDVLRCISKSQGQVLISFNKDVESKLSGTPSELSQEAERLQTALKSVMKFISTYQGSPDVLTFAARDLAYSLSRIYMGSLMIDHTVHCGMSSSDVYSTKRWCEQRLCLVSSSEQYSKHSEQMDRELVYG